MAYEVGVGYLDLVPSLGGNFRSILQGAGNDINRTLGQAGDSAGEQAGGLFSSSFGKILKAGALVGAVALAGKAAGAAFSATFGEAMERQAIGAKAAASLGLSDADSKALGASAGKLYAQAYGDSFEGVTDALTQVKSALGDLGGDQLEAATKKALSFSSAFDVEVSRSVSSVNTLIGSGLVSNADEAFDVITKASQKVPAALREDVLDASDEYSQFFNALGFNASQVFGALVSASDKGVFGIDKTGDAIKEFTIRATDMSTSTVAAFSSIGLDAQQMANDILAGGDTAQGATQKIIDGLLGIQDPATQANTAIALFGTPLEDLGVSDIPQFLSSLDDATGGLGDFAGAADAMDKQLGGTIQAKFTSLTRTLEGFGPALTTAILPVFGPILDSLTSFAAKGLEVVNGLIDGLTGGGGKGLTDAQMKWSIWGDSIRQSLIGPLSTVKSYAQDARAALSTLFTGNFDPSQWFAPPEEDSALIDFIFTIRETVGDTFKQLMDTGKQVFDAIGPPLIEAFKTIWDAVKPLVPTFLELFQAFNPVGLLFKALLPVLPQLAGVFGELAKTLAGGIARTLEALQPLFQKVVDVINRLLPFITKLIESLLPPLVSLFEKIAPLIEAILDALLPLVESIIDALIPAIDAIMPVVERVFTFIADTIGNIIDVFSGVIDFLTGVFTGDWSLMWQGIQEIFGGVWDQIQSTVSFVWDTISSVIKAGWENVIKPVFDAVMAGVTSVGDFFSRLWTDVVSPVWQWISDKITTVWNWIRDSVFKPLNDGVVAVGKFFSDLWGTVQDVWTWISDKVTTVWNWIRDNVFAPLKTGIESVGKFFSDLWGTVQDVWTWIQDKIGAAWNWINQYVFAPMNLGINTIGTFFGDLWQTIEDIWNKITGFFSDVAEGISSAVDTVKGAITDIKDAIANFLSGEWIQGSSHLGNLEVGNGLFGNIDGGARGAVVPGTDPGRRDNVLGMLPSGAFFGLRSEEAVMVPEFTHAVGGAPGVYALNRAAENGTLSDFLSGGFARGGVVGQMAHDAVVNPVMAFFEKIIDDFLAQFAAGGGVAPDGARGRFLDAMRSKIGTEYVWGAAGPNVFDCSGLISWALEQAGVGKGRLTAEGFNSGFPHTTNPAPGDMITFDTGRLPGQAGHIGAVSDPSRSMMIHTDGAGPAREQSYAGRPGFLGFVNVIGEEYKPKAASNLSGSEGDPATGTLDRIINKIKAGGTGVPSVSGSGTWGTTAKLNTNTPDQWADDGTMAMVGPVPPGGSVDRWRPMYADALMAKGMYSDTALNKMMYQMQRESSGNPLAINKSDRNWRAGYPSKSLLQVIGPTFRDNGEPGFNTNIWDPWSNALASLNYVYRRYGGPQNYPGGAYDTGGWLMPGTSGVNLLRKPEAVLTPQQSEALIAHAQNLARGFGGRAELDPGAIRQALDGMSMQLTDDEGNSFSARMRSTARSVMLSRERAQRSWG